MRVRHSTFGYRGSVVTVEQGVHGELQGDAHGVRNRHALAPHCLPPITHKE